MENEPVAWIDKVTGKPKMIGYIFADYDIPLYLHPAKKLTEYMKYRLAVKQFGENFCATHRKELLAYADAILRKAQEK